MLSPDYINNLPEGIVKYWQDVEDVIIKDVARRFQKMDGITGTAEIQRLTLKNLGADLTDIDKRIAEAVGKTQEDITQLFEEAAAKVQQDYDGWAERTGRTVDKGVINQITRAAIETAKGDFDNITGTMGYVTNNGQLSLWTQAYRQQLSFATMQVASGATSYTEAARQIIKTFASDGIMIQYPSGVRRSLETAIRLNISSGVAFMANSIAQENAEQLGTDGWEISAHMASAPDHEPYQGRQYTNAEYEALNNMLDRPIGTLNCRHIGYPIILGVSERAYTDAELDAMKRKNAEGIDYEGKHYTMYEATQMQRKLERAIRSCKRELIGADAAKDSELFMNKSVRLRILRDHYADFSQKAGLPTQNERAQVAGYGKSISAKAVRAEKEAYATASPRFLNKNDKLYSYAEKIKPIAGYEDVVVHGDKYGFVFKDANGNESNVSVKEFARISKESDSYNGGNIRLIACEAGADGSIVAQKLADIMNVNVMAATDIVHVDFQGNMVIGPDKFTNSGKWVIIKPKER